MSEHPVQLVVEDDLRRNRLTVFFRLILAIPHFIWVFLWSIAVFFAAIANWVVTLAAGRPAGSLHRFLSSYVRYVAHLYAYLWLVANPYPGFVGEEGSTRSTSACHRPKRRRAGRRSCASCSPCRR